MHTSGTAVAVVFRCENGVENVRYIEKTWFWIENTAGGILGSWWR